MDNATGLLVEEYVHTNAIGASYVEPSMDFSFYDQPFILDTFERQTVHQSLYGDYLNLSTVPSISAAFQTNAI